MSVNTSLSPLQYHCFDSRASVFIFTTFNVTKIFLLLPLFILILYLGYQRWRRQHTSTTTSHSDIFTYHMVAIELNSLLASILFICGSYTNLPGMAKVGIYVANMTFPGQMFFHILTCVERYLAVVHPITFLGLRKAGGVRIRNICIGCVWLLSFGWIGVTALYAPNIPIIPLFCFLVFSLIIVSFCSLSAVCVLIRSGPGEGGTNREQPHRSKQRAFHTIMTIMAVLWLWFLGILVCVALDESPLLTHSDGCVAMISGIWFSLPSSLVLPLLFLHRAGKLMCCHYSNEQ
eukprot:superscaffoldBa00009152_g23897